LFASLNFSTACDLLGRLAATDEWDRLPFRALEISDELVLVFREVDRRPRNLAVQQALLNLAEHETKAALVQRRDAVLLEGARAADRHRVADAGRLCERLQIGAAAGRRRLADAAAAVNPVVEDVHDEIGGIQPGERREIEKREQHAAVGLQHDHLAMRQRERQARADAERAAHLPEQQIAVALGEMAPLDALAALRSHDQVIGHERREHLEAFAARHSEKSPANKSADGPRSAFAARTAFLIFVSRPSPLTINSCGIASASSTGRA